MSKFFTKKHLFIFVLAGGLGFWGQNVFFKSFSSLEYVKGVSEGEIALPPKPVHLETPEAVKAIYMTSWVAGTRDWRNDLIDFIGKTELNSLIIDVKDYSGRVSFRTNDALIEMTGAEEERIPDIKEFIDYLHSRDIYVIARITVFQDPFYAKNNLALAVQRKDGTLWKDYKGLSFIDPGAREYWDYIVRVSRASEKVGFDELNFDYIRFPSDGNMKDIFYPISEGRDKVAVLDEFFSYLRANLSDLPVPLSADVFGMTTTNLDDLNIGQVLERIEPHFDYIAPMVYPSHYPPTFQGFKNPAEHPYEVVYHSMSEAVRRMSAPTSTPTKLRPWLQDFDLGADYDAAKIRAQKKAVYDAGLTSWMFWDAANRYTREAYE